MVKSKKIKAADAHERLFWHLGKLARARFWYLASRTDVRLLNAINIFLHSIISMIILGIAANITSWPLIFPSLGPTIFLIFYAPSSPMAAPRNAVLSHIVGAITGWLSFTALAHFYPEAASGSLTDPSRITTAALALGICGVFMSVTGIVHPPAASSTLIAGLGLMSSPLSILMVGAAVLFLCMQAWTMHWLAGIKYPAWSPVNRQSGPDIETKLGRLAPDNRVDRSNAVQDIAARLAARQKLK